MENDERVVAPAAGRFRAGANVPGDKSSSHRALILAAMARGSSEITGLGPGADIRSTVAAIESLGVRRSGGRYVSPGADGWLDPVRPIDCGNSGTTMRLLTGALAAGPFPATLVGDESLTRRPMRRLLPTLSALGASVELTAEGTAPIRVGGSGLIGASVTTEFASAQVRSAFELAAIRATGASEIDGPPGFRDHTERWLTALGLGSRPTPTRFRIEPGEVPAARYEIPGDPSSAAFLWASAALVPGAIVATPEVSLNPGRIGFLTILEAMGAKITAGVTGAIHGDPVGTVVVEGDELGSTEVSGEIVAAAIDELPLVAVLGAYGTGITVVRDATELRAKESDRIASTVDLIRALGGGAEASSDGFRIVGTGGLEAGVVDSRGDHRIAMTAAVAATAATGPVTVRGASVAAVSWPSFYDDLEAMWSSR